MIFLCSRRPVFAKKAKRKVIKHRKFYFFDTGVFHSLRPKGSLDSPDDIAGQALEGLVFQNLQAWIAYSHGDHQLYFWRSPRGTEVDFVIYGSTSFVAIEVKATTKLKAAELKGLKTFHEDYPQARRIFLYLGKEKFLTEDRIEIIPVDVFLQSLDVSSKQIPTIEV